MPNARVSVAKVPSAGSSTATATTTYPCQERRKLIDELHGHIALHQGPFLPPGRSADGYRAGLKSATFLVLGSFVLGVFSAPAVVQVGRYISRNSRFCRGGFLVGVGRVAVSDMVVVVVMRGRVRGFGRLDQPPPATTSHCDEQKQISNRDIGSVRSNRFPETCLVSDHYRREYAAFEKLAQRCPKLRNRLLTFSLGTLTSPSGRLFISCALPVTSLCLVCRALARLLTIESPGLGFRYWLSPLFALGALAINFYIY